MAEITRGTVKEAWDRGEPVEVAHLLGRAYQYKNSRHEGYLDSKYADIISHVQSLLPEGKRIDYRQYLPSWSPRLGEFIQNEDNMFKWLANSFSYENISRYVKGEFDNELTKFEPTFIQRAWVVMIQSFGTLESSILYDPFKSEFQNVYLAFYAIDGLIKSGKNETKQYLDKGLNSGDKDGEYFIMKERIFTYLSKADGYIIRKEDGSMIHTSPNRNVYNEVGVFRIDIKVYVNGELEEHYELDRESNPKESKLETYCYGQSITKGDIKTVELPYYGNMVHYIDVDFLIKNQLLDPKYGSYFTYGNQYSRY